MFLEQKNCNTCCKVESKKFIFLSSIKVHGEKTKEGFPLNNNSSFDPKILIHYQIKC